MIRFCPCRWFWFQGLGFEVSEFTVLGGFHVCWVWHNLCADAWAPYLNFSGTQNDLLVLPCFEQIEELAAKSEFSNLLQQLRTCYNSLGVGFKSATNQPLEMKKLLPKLRMMGPGWSDGMDAMMSMMGMYGKGMGKSMGKGSPMGSMGKGMSKGNMVWQPNFMKKGMGKGMM